MPTQCKEAITANCLHAHRQRSEEPQRHRSGEADEEPRGTTSGSSSLVRVAYFALFCNHTVSFICNGSSSLGLPSDTTHRQGSSSLRVLSTTFLYACGIQHVANFDGIGARLSAPVTSSPHDFGSSTDLRRLVRLSPHMIIDNVVNLGLQICVLEALLASYS